jgi:predicted RNase H-like HicB family nuclease
MHSNRLSIDETKAELRSAIRFHIEGLRADGLSVPDPISLAEYIAA